MSDLLSLHAYVADGQVRFKEPAPTAAQPFRRIYQNRPNGCRYMVASIWDMPTHARKYLVFDLFPVRKDPVTNELETPRPRLTHHDLDAAIMAALMLYERR